MPGSGQMQPELREFENLKTSAQQLVTTLAQTKAAYEAAMAEQMRTWTTQFEAKLASNDAVLNAKLQQIQTEVKTCIDQTIPGQITSAVQSLNIIQQLQPTIQQLVQESTSACVQDTKSALEKIVNEIESIHADIAETNDALDTMQGPPAREGPSSNFADALLETIRGLNLQEIVASQAQAYFERQPARTGASDSMDADVNLRLQQLERLCGVLTEEDISANYTPLPLPTNAQFPLNT